MVNFGIIYGISAFGLSENLEIPREQAQEYIDAYLARFPLVQDFIQRTIEQAKRDGYVTTLLGRRRPVPEIRASNRQTRSLGERLAVNFVMQGSNADIIKVAMIAHPPAAARGGPRRAARAPGARRAAARGAGRGGRARSRSSSAQEMCGAYPLDPPLAVDVGVGDDWNEAKLTVGPELSRRARSRRRPDSRGRRRRRRRRRPHGHRQALSRFTPWSAGLRPRSPR